MFSTKAVFPFDGRPAMTIKLEGCRPPVRLSKSSKCVFRAQSSNKGCSGIDSLHPVVLSIAIWRCWIIRQVLKPCGTLDERQPHNAGRAVALLRDNQLGFTLKIGIVRLVDFFAEDEGHHVGVLLNGAGFAQVR